MNKIGQDEGDFWTYSSLFSEISRFLAIFNERKNVGVVSDWKFWLYVNRWTCPKNYSSSCLFSLILRILMEGLNDVRTSFCYWGIIWVRYFKYNQVSVSSKYKMITWIFRNKFSAWDVRTLWIALVLLENSILCLSVTLWPVDWHSRSRRPQIHSILDSTRVVFLKKRNFVKLFLGNFPYKSPYTTFQVEKVKLMRNRKGNQVTVQKKTPTTSYIHTSYMFLSKRLCIHIIWSWKLFAFRLHSDI